MRRVILVRHHSFLTKKVEHLWPGSIFYIKEENIGPEEEIPVYVDETCTNPFMKIPKNVLYALKGDSEIYYVDRVLSSNEVLMRGTLSQYTLTASLDQFQGLNTSNDPIRDVQEAAYVFFPALNLFCAAPVNEALYPKDVAA